MSALSLARAALALLLVVAAGAWMLALFTSSQPSGPALLVYGEPVALGGSLWPVRVVAAWPEQKRRASFVGVVGTPRARVALEDGVARVPMPQETGPLTVVIEGESDGVPASVSVTVTVVDDLPPAPLPVYQPWTRELAAGSAKDRAGPPLYPVAGRQPAMLPSELVAVTEDALEIVSVRPNVAGTTAPDGRALRLDPTGIVLEVPVAASAGDVVDVIARSVSPAVVHLDLVVNGAVRDMRVASLSQGQISVRMKIPSDAGEGWFAVHGATSPLAGIRGATALGLLIDDAAALGSDEIVAHLASPPSLISANDPLLARLQSAAPTSLTPVRALLGRLRVDDVRPANLAPTTAAQAAHDEAERGSRTARYRAPFRVAGGLFALLAAALALVSTLQNARWREESDEKGRRQLAPAGWSLLALLASLSALWILDWAIGLMQNRPSG